MTGQQAARKLSWFSRLIHAGLTFLLIIGYVASFQLVHPAQAADGSGTVDTGFDISDGPDGDVWAALNQPQDGKIIIAGEFTHYGKTARSRIAWLQSNGLLDASINPAGANGTIKDMIQLPNGQILIGGLFSTYNGTSVGGLARINTDGSLDSSFQSTNGGIEERADAQNPTPPKAEVRAISLLPDGKIVIGGVFSHYNGVRRYSMALLDANGGLISGFSPVLDNPLFVTQTVNSIIIQQQPGGDSKIIIGGAFGSINSTARAKVARLNLDGMLDPGFNANYGDSTPVQTLALQSTGKVLIGGQFSSINSTTVHNIARLDAISGALDTSFAASDGSAASGATSVGADAAVVRKISVQPNDSMLVAGNFETFNNAAHIGVVKLAADGSIDPAFNPAASVWGQTNDIVRQTDGKLVFVGGIRLVNTLAVVRLFRFNADGTLDIAYSPIQGTDKDVRAISILPGLAPGSDKILAGGVFTSYNGLPYRRVVQINSNGSTDLAFNSNLGLGTNGDVRAIYRYPDGRVIIAGQFAYAVGLQRYALARLNVDGTLEPTFNPTAAIAQQSGPNDAVLAVAIQPGSGKILVGGKFTSFNGTPAKYLVRLNDDGSVDSTFNPAGTALDSAVADAREVDAISVVPASGPNPETILIGGTFDTYNGTARHGIARLNADGTLDASFNPGSGPTGAILGAGAAKNGVSAIAVQPGDGKIIAGGYFANFNGTSTANIVRLNNDGSLDTSFVNNLTGAGANLPVYAVTVQTNGQILIGGSFNKVSGLGANKIARLNMNGSLDASFNFSGSGPNNNVYAISLISAADGGFQIVIGGSFSQFNGWPVHGIALLNSDGSRNQGFNLGKGPDGPVFTVVHQPDGKLIIGGQFLNVDSVPQPHIARLNIDGTLDLSFAVGAVNGDVRALTLQNDGSVIAGGDFTAANGTNGIPQIARFDRFGSLDTSFNANMISTGINAPVTTLILQGSQILVGGKFTGALVRLNSDGTKDNAFSTNVGPINNAVYAIHLQNDGKILVGGDFTSPAAHLLRLNPAGMVDSAFNTVGDLDGTVHAIAVQPDNAILVGGGFTHVGATAHNRITRLLPTGAPDPGFNPGSGPTGSAAPVINSIDVQTNGKFIIGGSFTQYNHIARNNLARVNVDGSLDTAFNAGSGPTDALSGDGQLYFVQIEPVDKRVMIAGAFTLFNGEKARYLTRLYGAEAPGFLSGLPPAGYLNVPYTYTFIASGFPSEIKYALVSGQLPDGLIFDPVTGILSGTPTTVGPYTFTISASNGFDPVALMTSVIQISGFQTISTITEILPEKTGQINKPALVFFIVETLSGSSGAPSGSVTIRDGVQSCSGSLSPDPLVMNRATGSCSITFTTAGLHSLTGIYQPLDSNTFGTSTSATFSYSIDQQHIYLPVLSN